MDRRSALKLLAASATLPALPASILAEKRAASGAETAAYKPTAEDNAFLDELQHRGCMFFLDQGSPTTGQVLDRAKAFDPPGQRDVRRMASIAATGFGLTALCIAHRRGF